MSRFLAWTGPVLLAAMLAAAWGALFRGGMAGVVAWGLLISLVPFAGFLALMVTGARLVWTRRPTAPILTGMVLGVVALWPGAWNFGVLQIAYPASLQRTTPAATVRLPSTLPLRVAWGGDRLAGNRHAFTPDQRWAYDLVVEPAFTGSAKPEDYGCWGTEVVAPVAARVGSAHDGEVDAVPGRPVAGLTAPLGNHVALALDDGTWLVIAHLMRGSVRVHAGDRVEEGEAIGRCGNSGNTSEPHIHIHHQRQDPAEFPVNFAEGLPLFFRDHDGPAMPEGGFDDRDGRVVMLGPTVTHVGRRAP